MIFYKRRCAKKIMEILHCKTTQNHGFDSDIEGAYRLLKFEETVRFSQLAKIKMVSEAHMRVVHSPRYIIKVVGACKSKCELAEVLLNPDSYSAIMASVSLAVLAAQGNSFAITRPPGHHASREKAEGFCFFNNIAIAVSYLLARGERVCIIDIDGHHGNGTQSLFSNDDRVLFCSIHQLGVYPYSGSVSDIGKGPSFEKVINVPLMEGSGDDVFLNSIEFLKEKIGRFNPSQMAISVGVDGYGKDRLLKLNYTKRGYYEAGRLIASIGKPTFGVLEGGYHDEVAECVKSFVSGVSGTMFAYTDQLSTSSVEARDDNIRTCDKLSGLLNH